MSDAPDAAQEAPEATEQTDAEENVEFDTEHAKQKIAKVNAEARGLRQRLKEAEAKAAKLDEIEAAKKSEAEQLSEANERLLFELNDAKTALTRERVARRHGLPDHLADRLKGDTEEAMDEDAQILADLITPKVQRVDDPALGRGGDRNAGTTADQFAKATESASFM